MNITAHEVHNDGLKTGDTLRINGTWYEVEITECYTYAILRDKYGYEIKLHSDEPLAVFLATRVSH